jgi:hypothetical protein
MVTDTRHVRVGDRHTAEWGIATRTVKVIKQNQISSQIDKQNPPQRLYKSEGFVSLQAKPNPKTILGGVLL